MKMEQNRAPAAIVIARYGWKKNFAVRAKRFWSDSPPMTWRDTLRPVPNIRRAVVAAPSSAKKHIYVS